MPRGIVQRGMDEPGDMADLDPQRRKAVCVTSPVLNVLMDFRESSVFSAGEGGTGYPFLAFFQVFQGVVRKKTYHRHPWQFEPMDHLGRWLTLTDV